MFTDEEMAIMEEPISREVIAKVPALNDSYYLSPLMYIEGLGIKLTCSAQEYRHAVEMANDEDTCPEGADLKVIVDGILAYVFADQLEECGINLTTYFTYRFFPPSREFQEGLDRFEQMVREASQ